MLLVVITEITLIYAEIHSLVEAELSRTKHIITPALLRKWPASITTKALFYLSAGSR